VKLSDLRTFLDIIEAGSLTRAAQMRGATQPNLSRFLRELETRLDTTLVRRDGRGVQPTTAGEVFGSFAEETLSQFQAMRDEISGLAGCLPEVVKIAVPMRTEHLLLPAMLRTFSETEAGVTLTSREFFSEVAMQDLADRKIDAMIGYLPPVDPCSGQEIAREVFYAVGLDKFLGDSKAPITMREVLSLPVIAAGPERYLGHLHQAAAAANMEFRPSRFCSAADAMVAFAAEGEGVAILPFSNFQREAEREEVRFRKIIDPVIERQVYLNFRPGLNTQTWSTLQRLLLSAISPVKEKARWTPAGAGKLIRTSLRLPN